MRMKDAYDKMVDKLIAAGLGYPIPKKYNPEDYYKAGVLKKDQLKHCHWYYGLCRNAQGDIALWNQETNKFYYLRIKITPDPYVEDINHLADDNGYDLFVPFFEVGMKEQGEVAEPG